DALNVNTDNTNTAAVTLSASETLGAVSIGSGGTVTVAAGGDKVLRVTGLTVATGGKLDLGDNDLIVDYSGTSPQATWTGTAYAGVAGLIVSGRNAGPAVGSLWDGSGVVTSAAAAKAPNAHASLGF